MQPWLIRMPVSGLLGDYFMRYAILSDIHANSAALDAVLDRIKALYDGDAPVQYLVLGDLVGYGSMRGAEKCVRWLYQSGRQARWIPGNHDEWLANGMGRLSPHATITLLAHRDYLSAACPTEYEWFRSELARKLAVNPSTSEETETLLRAEAHGDGPPWAVIGTHGVLDLSMRRGDYLFPWHPFKLAADLATARDLAGGMEVCLLVGHTHFPMLVDGRSGHPVFRSIEYGKHYGLDGGPSIINPGSLGAPRDGDPRAAFALLDTHTRTVTFERVEYPVDQMVFQLEMDAAIASPDNPLPMPLRAPLLEHAAKLLGWEAGRAARREHWRSVYERLIDRLKVGDGQSELSNYRRVYAPTETGLKAISPA